MKSTMAALIINSGLLVVVMLMLSSPLLLGQLLATYETGSLGATTTADKGVQAQATSAGFAVYPNVADFAEYAEFATEPVIEQDFYQTSVSFTAFTDQQAAYNALFTIYNTSNSELTLRLEGGSLTGLVETSKVWVNFVPDGQVNSSLVTATAPAGTNEISVGQLPQGFKGNAVVGSEVVNVEESSVTTMRLSDSLNNEIKVGERVYYSPLFYSQSTEPALAQTQTVTLLPQQRAVVNLAVATQGGEHETTQVVMPLTIVAVGDG